MVLYPSVRNRTQNQIYIGVKGTSDADAAEKRKVLTKAVESLAE